MNNSNGSYNERVHDIISLKEILKKNVQKKDYSKEKIIEYWKEFLES